MLILAGSPQLSGAAVLSAKACLLSGTGLVTVGIPAGLNNSFIKIKPPEVMTLPLPEGKEGCLSGQGFKRILDFCKNIDILAIGPGLGKAGSTQALIRKLVKKLSLPMVIDADGLNALAGHLEIIKGRKNTVLTPHPGEMARLTRATTATVQKDRKKVAKDFVNRYNVILVLKGHQTLVAEKNRGLYLNKTGNPGMAKAGSGDVLTGIIAAFLAQGLSGFEAAKYGVYLHGTAGDLAAQQKTQLAMTASDIIENIPRAVKKCS